MPVEPGFPVVEAAYGGNGAADEPAPKDYQKEQWSMQLHEYYDRCPDTHMPTSIVAIVNLLNENLAALGKNARRSIAPSATVCTTPA